LQAIKFNPEDPEPYIQIADLYDLQGKEDIADAYSQKGIELKNELWEYPDFTVRNYQEIAERILFNKVHLICMQYPLRDGNSLKNIFLPWQQENIIFVDNKANFKHALKKNEYSKYFSDAFAGDFGHCTREGNRLIAENLAGVVLEKARGLRMGQEEIEKMGKVRE
jgi:hypothetical protein